jgi:hypothetical protein
MSPNPNAKKRTTRQYIIVLSLFSKATVKRPKRTTRKGNNEKNKKRKKKSVVSVQQYPVKEFRNPTSKSVFESEGEWEIRTGSQAMCSQCN